ncbi:hypothetical protein K493DRAFT_57125 [Basidiobolus meristosporus CBS 931.73]|uniref:Uncharacterized protein n=1 Tax=Basidiobolus meristosporus CBS 931.73 TaxID=1314790 RepID=A0A1Y1XY72_9FUNG|nr:hypothetical protein K493DRAFT_57125 [Basidiobolus meristosporus CBS 931.73]|eukprot:ORX90689.1 hypothetical protein K493DRAFT_57125 [Basidiobolus meristosporus CBS 931.73]
MCPGAPQENVGDVGCRPNGQIYWTGIPGTGIFRTSRRRAHQVPHKGVLICYEGAVRICSHTVKERRHPKTMTWSNAGRCGSWVRIGVRFTIKISSPKIRMVAPQYMRSEMRTSGSQGAWLSVTTRHTLKLENQRPGNTHASRST